jgi:PAS domain S-box-containing protein
LFWAMREVVVVADTDSGLIALWNPAAETLFGYAPHEAIGLSLDLVIPERFQTRSGNEMVWMRQPGRGELLELRDPRELVGLCKDGHEVTVEATFTRLDPEHLEGDGRSPGRYVLALIRDITDRKVLEADRAEKARLEGALIVARTVAHEINNALAPLTGFSDLLSAVPAVARDPKASTYAKLINDAAAAMAGKVTRLQRIVRLEQDTITLGPDRPVLDLERSTEP